MHRPAAAFRAVYFVRDCALPAAQPSSPSTLSNTPSVGRLVSSCAVYPPCLGPSRMPPCVGLTATENPGSTAGLKLEPSIYHSGFDAPGCLRRSIPLSHVVMGQDASMSSAHSLCSSSAILVGHCDLASSTLGVPLCV